MKPLHSIILIFTCVIGAIVLTHHLVADDIAPGVACKEDRIAAFGWTDKRGPVAEMAAIANWQRDAEKAAPGYGNWTLALKRSMKCQTFSKSSHIQCVVSARPCRYEKS